MRNRKIRPVLARYVHVDVFAERGYAGNSLPVFIDPPALDAPQMQLVTRELRHFEAAFVHGTDTPGVFKARIFDLIDELPFAGHPLIGAAAALHAERAPEQSRQRCTFELAARTVTVVTESNSGGFLGTLDQGEAEFLGEVDIGMFDPGAFNLSVDDLDAALPMAVVSTGLRYLIVPVRAGALTRATIRADITARLAAIGAQFAVLFDERAREIRHWNNDGIVEDVATGSAAGTIGAYCVRYGSAEPGVAFDLHQGRFAGRPSRLAVKPDGHRDHVHSVQVGGGVVIIGRGELDVLP